MQTQVSRPDDEGQSPTTQTVAPDATALEISPAGGARAQTLQRWDDIAPSPALAHASLLFEPIDGNPRHGVLALVVEGSLHTEGTLEVFERQGFWLAVPGAPWALAKAQHALHVLGTLRAPRSRIAGTPDQRFIFFNTWLQGVLVTQVERRDSPALSPL